MNQPETTIKPFDERSTAVIIAQVFPRKGMFSGPPNMDVSVTELNSALFRARKFSGSSTIGGCVDWARKILDDLKPTIRERIVARIDDILKEQESKPNADREENQ